MRLDRRFLNWGVFFIVLGAIPLAVQQGVLDRDLAARAWQLWPLLIIAAGVGLVLRRTSLEFLGGLIVAITTGAMLGGVIAVGADLADVARACGSGDGRAYPTQQGTLASTAAVRLELDCGDLTLTTAGGSGWTLAGTSDDGQPPESTQSADRLAIESRNRGFVLFGLGQSSRETWTVTLPTDPVLALSARVNAGSGRFALTEAKLDDVELDGNASSLRLDLTGSTVRRLAIQVNAGSARIQMPNGSVNGRLQANAGSLAFCVPDDVGLRIVSNDNITGSNNFEQRGLTKSGSTYTNAAYAAATNRIDLEVNVNAAGVTLNPEDGCR